MHIFCSFYFITTFILVFHRKFSNKVFMFFSDTLVFTVIKKCYRSCKLCIVVYTVYGYLICVIYVSSVSTRCNNFKHLNIVLAIKSLAYTDHDEFIAAVLSSFVYRIPVNIFSASRRNLSFCSNLCHRVLQICSINRNPSLFAFLS